MTLPTPIGKATPDLEIVSLRYILALAREDKAAARLATRQMGQFHPGDVVGMVGSMAVLLADKAAQARGEDVNELLERCMQMSLDRIEKEEWES